MATLSLNDDVLVKTDQAGKLLDIPPATLVKWRSTGENNIPYVKIGHHVRYRTSALREYIENHTKQSVSA